MLLSKMVLVFIIMLMYVALGDYTNMTPAKEVEDDLEDLELEYEDMEVIFEKRGY